MTEQFIHQPNAENYGIGFTVEQRQSELGRFMGTIGEVAAVIDSLGVPREDWFVIAGGAVALHQQRYGITERVPTDVDVVVRHDNKVDADQRLQQIEEGFRTRRADAQVGIILEPREHHGYIFPNPVLEVADPELVPVDILAEMTTVFPDNAPISSLRGRHYNYPVGGDSALFEATTAVDTEYGPVFAAHPAFIAFYKMVYYRNGSGKQDGPDVMRLAEMGLLEDQAEVERILRILSYDDEQVVQQIMEGIYSYKPTQ